VLFTKGVFSVIKDREIIGFIEKFAKEQSAKTQVEQIAADLCNLAKKRQKDNATVTVVKIFKS
jgi:serine/threonine protein phosphatase PrpC